MANVPELSKEEWEDAIRVYQAQNDNYWRSQNLSMPTGYQVIPQTLYANNRRFERHDTIRFGSRGGRNYIRLSDALIGNCKDLFEVNAPGLPDDATQKQSIRLQVEGTAPYERQVQVRDATAEQKVVSRGKLASLIAKEVFTAMTRHRHGPFGPPGLGLGPRDKGFERIVLIEVQHVSKSSWQPVLGVLL